MRKSRQGRLRQRNFTSERSILLHVSGTSQQNNCKPLAFLNTNTYPTPWKRNTFPAENVAYLSPVLRSIFHDSSSATCVYIGLGLVLANEANAVFSAWQFTMSTYYGS